jgi:hypothetical protein
VEKIEPIYNLISRPSMYDNPKTMTVMANPAADVAISGRKKVFMGPVKSVVSGKRHIYYSLYPQIFITFNFYINFNYSFY